MKKFFLLFLSVAFLMCFAFEASANCDYSGNILTSLDNCLSDSDLVHPGDGKIESGIKNQIVYWTTQLASLLGLLAVGAIVYGGLLMTISAGEDEKIKKGKDIVKWSLLGFLALIAAGAVVRLVVELMFSFTS